MRGSRAGGACADCARCGDGLSGTPTGGSDASRRLARPAAAPGLWRLAGPSALRASPGRRPRRASRRGALPLAHVPQHPSAPRRGAAHDRRRRSRRRAPVRPQGERLAYAPAPERGRVRGCDRRRGRGNGPAPCGTWHAARRRRGDTAGPLAAIGSPSRDGARSRARARSLDAGPGGAGSPSPVGPEARRVTDDAARRQWAAVAERYGAGWKQANAPDLGWLVAALDPVPTDRALDVGTGGGHAALALAPAVATVVAIDPTPEMLAVASRLAAERGIANVTFA